MTPHSTFRHLLAAAVAAVVAAAVLAAVASAATTSPTTDATVNPGLGPAPASVARTTPRAAVVGFLEAARAGRFDLAAHYLDLAAVPELGQASEGPRLARRLKIVLDQTFWVVPSALSEDPAGHEEAGLDGDDDLLTSIPVGSVEVAVVLHRHADGEGGGVWMVAADTVAAIDRLYAAHGYGRMGDVLPSFFFSIRPFEVELWQWCGIAVLLVVGWLLSRAVAPTVLAFLRRAAGVTESPWDDALVEAVAGPLKVAIAVAFLFVSVPWLKLSVAAGTGSLVVGKLAVVLVVGWFASSAVGVVATGVERTAIASGNQLLRSFAPLMSRLLKTTVWIGVVVVGADAIGHQLTGLIAGLGIGGLAVAFAAKNTIENLFGSVAIAADRTFEVGSVVTIGDVTGTVEEVGLRSTRIRTVERTLVTIPNGVVMAGAVVNLSKRDRIKYQTTVGLLYGTSAAQLEWVVDEIKKVLHAHPMVSRDLARVRFDSFGDSSLNVSVLTHILTCELHRSTAVAEELNFAILRVVEASGSGFAFPSQTTYRAEESMVDARPPAGGARGIGPPPPARARVVPPAPPAPPPRPPPRGRRAVDPRGATGRRAVARGRLLTGDDAQRLPAATGLVASTTAEETRSSRPGVGDQALISSRLAGSRSTLTSAKPISCRVWVSSSTAAAPAAHDAHAARSLRSWSLNGAWATTSEIARRPPGRSTRKASR